MVRKKIKKIEEKEGELKVDEDKGEKVDELEKELGLFEEKVNGYKGEKVDELEKELGISKEKEEKLSQTSHKKQLRYIVIIMMGVLAIIFVSYAWMYFTSKYDYMNLEFQKTQLGEIIFHSTRIPIVGENNKITSAYSINFRNDPRRLEKIPSPASPPAFIHEKTVYLSINPEMEACELNSVAIMTLSGFLRDFANLTIEAAFSDSEYAEQTNYSYVTCDSHMDYTVLILNSGDETKIEKTGAHCYELTYANCEIMPVTEKFMVEIMREYMSYFKKIE